MTSKTKIAVLGGGAWGTALAAMSATSGHETWLYARDSETVNLLNQQRLNPRYLGDIKLPEGICASTDAKAVLTDADAILTVLPAQVMRDGLSGLSALIPISTPVILCAKGIERGTGRLMSEVVAEVLPNHTIAALSGPSFATDVAAGLPTAVTIACEQQTIAEQLATLLSGQIGRAHV